MSFLGFCNSIMSHEKGISYLVGATLSCGLLSVRVTCFVEIQRNWVAQCSLQDL